MYGKTIGSFLPKDHPLRQVRIFLLSTLFMSFCLLLKGRYQLLLLVSVFVISTALVKVARGVFLQDPDFYVLKEDTSPCIFGSIEKQRWSYACAKQLIERLVYGMQFFSCLIIKFNVLIGKKVITYFVSGCS